jgi:hypothetical protein
MQYFSKFNARDVPEDQFPCFLRTVVRESDGGDQGHILHISLDLQPFELEEPVPEAF